MGFFIKPIMTVIASSLAGTYHR